MKFYIPLCGFCLLNACQGAAVSLPEANSEISSQTTPKTKKIIFSPASTKVLDNSEDLVDLESIDKIFFKTVLSTKDISKDKITTFTKELKSGQQEKANDQIEEINENQQNASKDVSEKVIASDVRQTEMNLA